MRHVCLCNCHVPPDDMRAFQHAGVDVRNVLEAAIACPACQNTHTPALQGKALVNEGPAPVRGVIITTPEGKTMTWAEHEKEMEQRAFRPKLDQGEGPEC